MTESTGEYSMDQNILRYVQYSLELQIRAGRALNREEYDDFTEHLSDLSDIYWDKFERREDVERPGFVETEKLGAKVPTSVYDLSKPQKEVYYYKIRKLMEKLGHTAIETEEWDQTQI